MKKVLSRANRYLTPERWITGEERVYFQNDDGDNLTHRLPVNMCAIGAAMEAQERLKLPIEVYLKAKDFLDNTAHEKVEVSDIVTYNDEDAGNVHNVKKIFIAAQYAVNKALKEIS